MGSAHRAQLIEGTEAPVGLVLTFDRCGASVLPRLGNATDQPFPIKRVVLFDREHELPPDSALYGEGFTMLGETAGTLAQPMALDEYTDRAHYRLPEPEGFRRVCGMMTVTPPLGPTYPLAFTSCERFVGKFDVNGDRIPMVLDIDGLTLGLGQTWVPEHFHGQIGPDRSELLANPAQGINHHHPRLSWPDLPIGWRSWYCFGPQVTSKNVMDTLADC